VDLITNMVVSKKDAELDWDAGMKAVATLGQDDVDLNWVSNFVGDLDEDDNVNIVEVRERVEQALENVRGHIEGMSRMLNVWELFGHKLYIFGESSWGDADEVFDDVSILSAAPSVMVAIGFITDFKGE